MKHILLVDDDPFFCREMIAALQERGFRTTAASDGRQALKAVRGETVDLAIIDLFMPEMDGLETIQALRRQLPDLKIFTISGGSPGLQKELLLPVAQRMGALRTFQKPFDNQAMLDAASAELQD